MTRDAFSARRAQGERSINGYCQPRQRTACLAQGYPPARLNRRFALSPVDALVDIKIGCGLRRQIPVRLDYT